MQSRQKSSKFVNFFLLPFSLCLVGGVAEVVQAQIRREGNVEIAQKASGDSIPIRIPSLVIPDNSQIIQSRKAEAVRLLQQGRKKRRASDYNNAIQLDLKAW